MIKIKKAWVYRLYKIVLFVSLFFVLITYCIGSYAEFKTNISNKEKLEIQYSKYLVAVNKNKKAITEREKDIIHYVLGLDIEDTSFIQEDVVRPIVTDEHLKSLENYVVFDSKVYSNVNSSSVTNLIIIVGVNHSLSIETTWLEEEVIYVKTSVKPL